MMFGFYREVVRVYCEEPLMLLYGFVECQLHHLQQVF
jgi:hypothetical protein